MSTTLTTPNDRPPAETLRARSKSGRRPAVASVGVPGALGMLALSSLAATAPPAVAATKLEDYLSTGACKEGAIGLPDAVRKRPNGAFDLGLSLGLLASIRAKLSKPTRFIFQPTSGARLS